MGIYRGSVRKTISAILSVLVIINTMSLPVLGNELIVSTEDLANISKSEGYALEDELLKQAREASDASNLGLIDTQDNFYDLSYDELLHEVAVSGDKIQISLYDNQSVKVCFDAGVSGDEVKILTGEELKFTVKPDTGVYLTKGYVITNFEDKSYSGTGLIEDDVMYVTVDATAVADLIEGNKPVYIIADTFVPVMELKQSDDETIVLSGNMIKVDYDKKYKLDVISNKPSNSYTPSILAATLSQDSVITEDGVSANLINPTTAEVSFNKASGKTTTIKVKPASINDQTGSDYLYTKVKVNTRITSARIDADSIKQVPGTSQKYLIQYNDNSNVDDLAFDKLSAEVSGNTAAITETNVHFTDDYSFLEIPVNTLSAASMPAYVTVYRTDSEGKVVIGSVKVEYDDYINNLSVNLNEKSIKYKNDRYVAIDLNTSGSLKGIRDLYYEVEVNNKEKDASKQGNMLSRNQVTIPVDSNTGLITNPISGMGAAVKNGLLYLYLTKNDGIEGTGGRFDYSVRLIQKSGASIVNETALSTYSDDIETPAPVYATNISLINKKTKAYTNQPELTVASVKFDKTVTYKGAIAELITDSGTIVASTADNTIEYSEDNGAVTIKEMPDIPARYTLKVTYRPEDIANAATTSMTINVVQAINSLEVNAPETVCKERNKAVSIPVSVIYNDNNSSIKPATKKVNFTLASTSPTSAASYVTVNKSNGRIVINKECSDINSITIKAQAADYANNAAMSIANVTISNRYEAIGKLEIAKKIDGDALFKALGIDEKKNLYSDESSEITGKYVVPVNTNVNENQPIAASNITKHVTFKSSNPRVVDVSSNGLLIANGIGRAIITAVTTDGGNSIRRLNIEVAQRQHDLQIYFLNGAPLVVQAGSGRELSHEVTYNGLMTDGYSISVVDESGTDLYNHAKYSVLVKDARILNRTGNVMVIQPTSTTSIITLKYGKVKKDYYVTNTYASKVKAKSFKNQNVKVVAGKQSLTQVKYELKDELGNGYTVKVTPNLEMSYSAKTKDVWQRLYYGDITAVSLKDGVLKFNIDSRDLPVGKYKLFVSIIDSSGRIVAAPSQIWLAVSKPDKVMITSSIGLSMKVTNTPNENTINLTNLIKVKNANIKSVELVNARTKYKTNDFVNKFELSSNTKIESIRPKVSDLSKVSKDDLVGYLKVTYTQEDTDSNVEQVAYVKVTVKLNK